MPATPEQQTKPVHQTDIARPPKPRTGKGSIAAGLAVLGCIAACTLPVLLTGGLAAGFGALFNNWNVAAVIILVAAGGAAVIWRRRKQTSSRAATATDGSFSCGSGGC